MAITTKPAPGKRAGWSGARVAVVEPHMLLRVALNRSLQRADGLELAAEFADPTVGMEAVLESRPDVVTISASHPGLGPFVAAEAEGRLRLVLLIDPGSTPPDGFPATRAGVAVPLPDMGNVLALHRAVDSVLVAAQRVAGVPIQLRSLVPPPSVVVPPASGQPARTQAARAPLGGSDPIVVIGSSTGGPRALASLVEALPPDLPAGLVIVQHMPAGFTLNLAKRLADISAYAVTEARDGDLLERGRILLAPGDRHLFLERACRVRVDDGPRLHGVRPAVDHALKSAVAAYGSRVLAVVLTGMGVDGARGAVAVRNAGGRVIAEDESTTTVFGMPKAVIEAGAADAVLPLHSIAPHLVRWVQEGIR